jgi:hypothetical protein
MPPMDDIKGENPASLTEKPNEGTDADPEAAPKPPRPRRNIGPESEVRGGPEAPED